MLKGGALCRFPLPFTGEGKGEGSQRRAFRIPHVRAGGRRSEFSALSPLILTFSREREKGRPASRLHTETDCVLRDAGLGPAPQHEDRFSPLHILQAPHAEEALRAVSKHAVPLRARDARAQ